MTPAHTEAPFVTWEARGLVELCEALDRAHRKDYMPDAMQDEWEAFDYRRPSAALAQPLAHTEALIADLLLIAAWHTPAGRTPETRCPDKQKTCEAAAAALAQPLVQAEPSEVLNDGKAYEPAILETDEAMLRQARSAQEQYDESMAGGLYDGMTPLDRLRFFCSIAMRGQDWLDVEPFFDAVIGPPTTNPKEKP